MYGPTRRTDPTHRLPKDRGCVTRARCVASAERESKPGNSGLENTHLDDAPLDLATAAVESAGLPVLCQSSLFSQALRVAELMGRPGACAEGAEPAGGVLTLNRSGKMLGLGVRVGTHCADGAP